MDGNIDNKKTPETDKIDKSKLNDEQQRIKYFHEHLDNHRLQLVEKRRSMRNLTLGLESQSNTQNSELWTSKNPFINFMQQFRKSSHGQSGANILRVGGKQWRSMSETEKQPFVNAANLNKNVRHGTQQKKQSIQNSQDLGQSQKNLNNVKRTNRSDSTRNDNLSNKRKRIEIIQPTRNV